METSDNGLWHHLLATKLYRCLLVMLVWSIGFATLVPVLPTILTNFFASRHAGRAVDCQLPASSSTAACQDAHADVVQWTSWTSLVANTFLSFLFAPIVGDLSDSWGRKPFILAGLALSTLPVAAVFLHLQQGLSLLWYYPLNALSSLVSAIVVFLSYTADVLPPQHRTAGFGLIVAAFSTGFVIGPLLAGLLKLTPTAAAAAAGGGCLAAMAIVVLAVPESRPPGSSYGAGGGVDAVGGGVASAGANNSSSRQRQQRRRPQPLDALLSLSKSWQLINSSTLFRRLALCMAIVGVVSEGIQDMLVQYLQLVVGFTTADQSLLFTLLGAANLLVQAVLLPWLVARLGERRLLVLGLLFSILEQAFLALAVRKWQALAAVALGSMAGVSFPAISSIKSTHSRADQQGLVQGALAGIRALATGLGPLAFAQLFAMCTKTSAVFGYRPGLVFWTTCGLTIAAAAVAASIPAQLIRKPGTAAEAAASDGCAAADVDSEAASAGSETEASPLLTALADDLPAPANKAAGGAAAVAAAAAAAAAKSGKRHQRAAAAADAPAGAGDIESGSTISSSDRSRDTSSSGGRDLAAAAAAARDQGRPHRAAGAARLAIQRHQQQPEDEAGRPLLSRLATPDVLP